jgi:protein-L-isoaspartate(D-aspartate) O-methyltransferase
MMGPAAAAAARAAMVNHQLRARGIRDPRVLAAMGLIPRERFVDRALSDRAYADAALPAPGGQTISQPLMVALMTELLCVEPGVRVLDVGTGTGYQAAVLAAMGARVTGIEWIAELVGPAQERLDALIAELGLPGSARVDVGNGWFGRREGAPWERILVAAGARRVPEALVEQLADGGRLVIPVGAREGQDLLLVERRASVVTTSSHGPCVFVPLVER